jgi:hypothetical protein
MIHINFLTVNFQTETRYSIISNLKIQIDKFENILKNILIISNQFDKIEFSPSGYISILEQQLLTL